MRKGKSRPTISDVAREAGVSISTVSRVMNGTAPVADETMQRVLDAVAALNYTPQAAARTLAGRRTQTIGLLLPEISGGFFVPMLRGVEATVRAAGYDLLIYATAHAHSGYEPAFKPLGEHNTDGLLVFAGRLDDAEIARLYSQDFPLVLLHRNPPTGLAIPYVTFENKAGATKAVEHLITNHGRSRILYLAGPRGNEDSAWRLAGYRQALKNHGLAFDSDLVVQADFDEACAHRVVADLLANGVRFDAIFAGDDESAMGALLALRETGKRVPDDVSLIGFDDILAARHIAPPLTTVRAPIEQAGAEATRQLLNVIEGNDVTLKTLLPTELIVRASCGCPHTQTHIDNPVAVTAIAA
ncbi:MAG: LacI family DNA-binding transcriptional regulator [Caldilineales bacterium]|nr:LacI family DNA-binding transcriptional regulator [Caldilineales bacterium]